MLLRSIRSRLLGLVLATVVPFTTVIGVGLWNRWRSDHNAAVERSLDEARLLAAQVDDHINNIENLLAGLSGAVSSDPADFEKNHKLLVAVKNELPSFVTNIRVIGLDGHNLGTSSDEKRGERSSADRPYFRGVLEGKRIAVGDVARARPNGRWAQIIARPIKDENGKLKAVLTVGTWLEHFQDALRVHDLPPGSVVRILNEHGIVVAQSLNGPNWIGRDLSGSESIARYLRAKEASEVTVWTDGVERITGSATAHTVPWLVSVGVPTEAMLDGMAWRFVMGGLIVGATLLIASVIAWMLSGRIVRPLRQLREDALALAAGEVGHRTGVTGGDEVGVLADAFNRMAASLQQRQEEAARAADEVRQTKDTLATVIDASPVAIVCSDAQRRIFIWNRSAQEIFGFTAEEAADQFANLMPPKGTTESMRLFDRAIAGETLRNLRLKRRRKDGSQVNIRAAAAPIYNPDGTTRGVVRAYEDITDYVRAETQLERIAHYDQLTGLPNRLTLQKQLGRHLSADGSGKPTAIALFDLDGFKDVNDTLGHSVGDQLLIEVGERLTSIADGRGTVCRLGGDEFVVVIPECGDPLVIGGIIDKMLKRLAERFEIGDQIVHLGGSAGIAIAPADGTNVDALIANADLALYQAKSAGGRSYRFYLPLLRAQAQARRSLDLELRRAFAEKEFEIYYQPQVRLADEAIVGAEALLRWRHPERGILAPGAFIDTLGASSIAPDVTKWIIRTACAQTAAWRAMGLPLGRIGVNLFPSQLADETLLNAIDSTLQETGLPHEALELEITENVALNYRDATVLQTLQEKGVKIAFDDFGTGYASLSYLTRFPLSRIKIDRSFITKITDDAEDAAIVRALIAMAHNLDLEVIAEGVETPAQAAYLLKEKCGEAQGYLYAKPLPVAEFEAYLRARHLSLQIKAENAETRARHEGFARRRAKSGHARRNPAA